MPAEKAVYLTEGEAKTLLCHLEKTLSDAEEMAALGIGVMQREKGRNETLKHIEAKILAVVRKF